jgi:hypothetical protein
MEEAVSLMSVIDPTGLESFLEGISVIINFIILRIAMKLRKKKGDSIN